MILLFFRRNKYSMVMAGKGIGVAQTLIENYLRCFGNTKMLQYNWYYGFNLLIVFNINLYI